MRKNKNLFFNLFIGSKILRIPNVSDIVCTECWGQREHGMVSSFMELLCSLGGRSNKIQQNKALVVTKEQNQWIKDFS